MTTLQITIPDQLRQFVEHQVAERKLDSVGAYVAALVQDAWQREEKAKHEVQCLEGLHSGPAVELTEEYWDALDREVMGKSTRARKP